MKRLLLIFTSAALLSLPAAFADGSARHSYLPPGGYVPDAKTAIRIAVAVWSPIYGEKKIQNEKPFHATLKKGVWTVEGSLPKARLGGFTVGGVAEADIARRNGRIVRVSHGK